MNIGGFQKCSLIEYPGKICAVIFTQGCNYRCDYCHNPELVDTRLFENPILEKEIFSFLEKRKGKLEAVEITGGEPTLQSNLLDVLRKIKAMGYLLKLNSNGSNPEVIKKAIDLKLIDYLAMDIKAPFEKYVQVVKANVDLEKVKESIRLIMSSKLNYEFCTTVLRSQLSKDDIIEIGKIIKGAKLYILQKFIPSKTLNPQFLKEKSYSDKELEELKMVLKNYVDRCVIR